ncbi:glycosyltransferase family 2 protein [Clostridium perfringens]|uniref:glycosyltransferase family 2 protein n=1 Tax=Clostridium perfringens TaxID=1502 RepID=UPI001A1B7A0A|nr:glycosyltransferase [Clostridium perfringens]EJT6167518.1 glycosyltransferase [Clostridium perfringens]EJT6620367.1 glycosyltransferase [Clostridium perfringens]ELC8422938.1 glycosyltransferase [Clostridium perfringens]MBO3404641.1 glycosyltransferase [Clostridium perfringens]MDM0614695.1 glycosyltransferase [Clostridium perfringens]
MDLITVIVPIFNVENYLSKCIESIIKQTYRNLEIILVDDGSTDDSPIICDKYAKLDSRIKVIHKLNGGLSDARNCGMRIAQGRYIAFVDSDDYIEKYMYEILYNEIIEYQADIAVCGRIIENGDEKKQLYTLNNKLIMDSIQTLKYYFKRKLIDPSACDKLFKRELFNNIEFPVGKIHEDIFVMDIIINNCNKIVHTGLPLYHYINRHDSITKKRISEKNLDFITAHEEIFNRYNNFNELKKYVESYYFEGYIIMIDKLVTNYLDKKMIIELNRLKKVVKNNILKVILNTELNIKYKIKAIFISFFWWIYKNKYSN